MTSSWIPLQRYPLEVHFTVKAKLSVVFIKLKYLTVTFNQVTFVLQYSLLPQILQICEEYSLKNLTRHQFVEFKIYLPIFKESSVVHIGRSKGGTILLRPISFIFMQFSAKFLLNNRFSSKLRSWRLLSGKSWIRHWFKMCLVIIQLISCRATLKGNFQEISLQRPILGDF